MILSKNGSYFVEFTKVSTMSGPVMIVYHDYSVYRNNRIEL